MWNCLCCSFSFCARALGFCLQRRLVCASLYILYILFIGYNTSAIPLQSTQPPPSTLFRYFFALKYNQQFPFSLWSRSPGSSRGQSGRWYSSLSGDCSRSTNQWRRVKKKVIIVIASWLTCEIEVFRTRLVLIDLVVVMEHNLGRVFSFSFWWLDSENCCAEVGAVSRPRTRPESGWPPAVPPSPNSSTASHRCLWVGQAKEINDFPSSSTWFNFCSIFTWAPSLEQIRRITTQESGICHR